MGDRTIRPMVNLETVIPFYDFYDAFSAGVWCKTEVSKKQSFLKGNISILQKSVGIEQT